MAKKNWWFNLLKNLISCESKPKSKKGKTKHWRWIFDRLRFKQLPATSTTYSTLQEKSLSEAREEQRKIVLNVARATAAAAEAAVAAAQAAAEVVRLTGVSRHSSLRQYERAIQNMAAIKIQTAFRAYLARKALRALKGVVRIQAIARGQAVRRRVSTELQHLKCIHPITQAVHTKRAPNVMDQSPSTKNEISERSKLQCKSQRQWTDSLFSKEEIESIYLHKQEAGFRRERMKQYSFSHRERQCSQILEETRNNEEKSCLRKQWAEEICDKGFSKGALLELHPDARSWDLGANLRIKPRAVNLAKQDCTEEVSSPFSHPRRSFGHMRLKQGSDDCQLSNSSMFPTYMAVTESAKAKMRSMSTPRQRLSYGYLDSCFEHYESPCKNRLYSSWSSYNGESSALGRTKCS